MSLHYRILIIVSIFLIASFTGCIETTDDNDGNDRILLGFTEHQLVLENITGFTYEGQTNTTILPIDLRNITRINFTLKWVDNKIHTRFMGEQNEMDSFELDFRAPYNLSFNYLKTNITDEGEETGYVFIEVLINTMPQNYTLRTENLEWTKLQYRTNYGAGQWLLNVTCLDAPGFYQSCMPSPPWRQEDRGNPWVITATVYYYVQS